MSNFFNDNVLLSNSTALEIYKEVKNLPIIDYHCHLNQHMIKSDDKFEDIGALWLAGDHYKWRAMRMCGVDEHYITGNASFHDKFIKYAEIVPMIPGNPLYYWTHMELKQIFGIDKPLNKDTAEEIYNEANLKLKDFSVRKLLKHFGVKVICTTDDPVDDLLSHGTYEGIEVRPTFRPDKLYLLEEDYLQKLGEVSGVNVDTLEGLLEAVAKRLDYFVAHGCKISDHGFAEFPSRYISFEEAKEIYANRANLTPQMKEDFFGFLLVWLTKEYKKRNLVVQLHFSVIRNNNERMFKQCGVDSGFDLIGKQSVIQNIILYLNQVSDDERPEIVLYTLNDANLAELSCVTGAFRHVRMGAAWWFNDTLRGIRRNLEIVSEYSALGTSFGMLTDSRSFSSYARFDFFRRILANYLGELVEKGEYDIEAAKETAYNICYGNIKNQFGL